MRYASIRKMDISNGEGVGVSLFVQGCPHHCKGCFNADTWDFNGGKEFTPDVFTKFMKLIDRPYIKFVSILGGEPLCPENISTVCNIVSSVRSWCPDKKIYVWTGYTLDEIMRTFGGDYRLSLCLDGILSNIDYLIDGRYVDELHDDNLHLRGSSNQRVIDMKEFLKFV